MKTKISIAALLVVTVLFLAGCQSSQQSTPIHNGQEGATALTAQEAQKVALENAGVTIDVVTNLHVTTDTDDGRTQYEVDFRHGDYEYEYEIDAATGKITSRSKDYEAIPPATQAPPATEAPPVTEAPPATEAPPTTAPAPAETEITASKAKKIALDHAGFKESAVTRLTAKKDIDDGVAHYDVEFRKGDYEYDYEINAKTGKIIKSNKEYDPEKASGGSTTETTKPATTDNITSAKAKSIALKHAGLKEADVTGLRVTLDKDDGVTHYDVEFRKGNYEYSYEINAKTGKIIEWDKDFDD